MCSVLKSRKQYVVVQTLLIVAMYALPYTLLADSKDLSLFVLWTAITLLVGVLGVLWLSRGRGTAERW